MAPIGASDETSRVDRIGRGPAASAGVDWEITMGFRRILWVTVAFVLAGVPAARSATIWVEGEKPVRHTMNRHPWWYDKVKRGQLSAGDWISNFGRDVASMYKSVAPLPISNDTKINLRNAIQNLNEVLEEAMKEISIKIPD